MSSKITRAAANRLAHANGWIFADDRAMDTACNVCGQVGATSRRGGLCGRQSPKWEDSRVCPGHFLEVTESSAPTEGPNPGDANTDANMANRVLASGGKPTGESGEGWDCETCEDVQIVESDVPGSPVPHVGECPACAPTEEPEPPTTNEKLTSVKLVVEPSHTVEEECRELGITPPSKQEQLDNISRETGYYPAPEPSPSQENEHE